MFNLQIIKKIAIVLSIALISVTASFAQTSVFTYQGRFTDSTAPQPTNGSYEMQFKLYTTAQINTGTQVGETQTIPTVQVVNGIFTVQLDAENSFRSGADLFIEINVRPAGSSAALTKLAPRQQVTSAPYAVQSRNALTATSADDTNKLGGIAASGYVQTGDSRLSDARMPTAGSADYIQNTTAPQASANFNVSGNGTAGGTLSANVVNSQTNYQIGGATVFSTPNSSSVVVGQSSNHASTANFNAFFGAEAGQSNTTGAANTFVGNSAGRKNLDGKSNVFVGKQAGDNNTSGSNNVFAGFAAGRDNIDGSRNSFVGDSAGQQNNSGSDNSFFGNQAGSRNTVSENSFFGAQAGLFNSTGTSNSFFGFQAGRATATGIANSFFGYKAGDTATGDKNTFVGTQSGFTATTGTSNSFFGFQATGSGNSNVVAGANTVAEGNANAVFGFNALSGGNNNTIIGWKAAASDATNNSTAIGSGASVSTNNTIVLGTNAETTQIPGAFSVNGKAKIITLGAAGSTSLCRNAANEISTCTAGNFAENKQVENNAATIKELGDQRARIEAQQKQISQQQILIESLRKLVCASNSTADVCQEAK